jgi:hypothetical protein
MRWYKNKYTGQSFGSEKFYKAKKYSTADMVAEYVDDKMDRAFGECHFPDKDCCKSSLGCDACQWGEDKPAIETESHFDDSLFEE